MELITALKDTPVPTLLVIGGFIFLFLGIATIKKPIVLDVTPSSRKISLVLGILFVGTGLYLLLQPSSKSTENTVILPTPTSDIVFNVNKEEGDGCYVRFNGVHIDKNSADALSWEWGDGNFTKGFFPQEHTYTQGGSYTVIVTAPSGAKKSLIIDVDCASSSLSTAFFSLKNANSQNFYTLHNGAYIFLENSYLAISGGYADGIYINQPLPRNFKVTIQFEIQHPDDQFIVGISNGQEMRPNYHLVMTATYTSFKQQFGFDVTEEWDKSVKSVNQKIKPGNTYEVVFERRNGGVNILANNISIIGLGALDVKDINNYNYLYLTGALNQQLIIKDLEINETQ